jgi:hypothetical protein
MEQAAKLIMHQEGSTGRTVLHTCVAAEQPTQQQCEVARWGHAVDAALSIMPCHKS